MLSWEGGLSDNFWGNGSFLNQASDIPCGCQLTKFVSFLKKPAPQQQRASSANMSGNTQSNTQGGGDFVDLSNCDDPLTFTYPGNPKSLPRARHCKKVTYNPARKELNAFKQFATDALPGTANGPLFKKGVPVSLKVMFYTKRPKEDFKKDNRGFQRLKTAAFLKSAPPIGADIDNLAKFVLDALNGIAYADDRQVVKLVATKLRDNDGDCLGRTVVTIEEFQF